MNLGFDVARGLTPHERRVLDALLTGDTEGAIAHRLHSTACAITNASKRLREKLGCRNRIDFVIWAYESGYLLAGKPS